MISRNPLVIALTSIPPRFGGLPQVLASLLAQGAERVALVIPRRYARFDGAALPPLPPLPEGVEQIETAKDLGPAGKLLAPATAFPGADILYCDDDWHYGPGWAAAFRARRAPGTIVAASTWDSARIGRPGGTIVQGFAGVLVPGAIAARVPPPPDAAWAVDDIWLSGCYAGLGAPIVAAKVAANSARALVTPLASPGALQDLGARDAANRAAAALVHERFGIWPGRG